MRQHRTLGVLDSQTPSPFPRVLRTALASTQMKYAGRIIAGLYASIVLMAALWAFGAAIYFRHQQVEHLLPSVLLSLATLPLSLALTPLYSAAPTAFENTFVQLALLTVCGAVQASVLWWLVSPRVVISAR